jgi:hypothetical protein
MPIVAAAGGASGGGLEWQGGGAPGSPSRESDARGMLGLVTKIFSLTNFSHRTKGDPNMLTDGAFYEREKKGHGVL